MQLFNSQSRYGAIAQFLHWTVVALVLLAWILGVTGGDEANGGGRTAGLFIHMTAGLAVIALTIVRLLWRLRDPSPPPERTLYGEWAFAGWMGLGAKLAHLLLYGLMIAVPAAGIALQFARGESLPIFGIVDIASPWSRDRALTETLGEVHELLAHSLLAVAALHAAAAIVHHWVFGDRTLVRMLPGGN